MRYYVACQGYHTRLVLAPDATKAAIAFGNRVRPPSGTSVFVWAENSPAYGSWHQLKYLDMQASRLGHVSPAEDPYSQGRSLESVATIVATEPTS